MTEFSYKGRCRQCKHYQTFEQDAADAAALVQSVGIAWIERCGECDGLTVFDLEALREGAEAPGVLAVMRSLPGAMDRLALAKSEAHGMQMRIYLDKAHDFIKDRGLWNDYLRATYRPTKP